ncbi:MAG TPA: WXG100 family type VII secretion target [Pseudonocardiaceae bacterium]
MDGFDAEPVELRVCGSMLSQISTEVHEQMIGLQAEADGLFAGGWQGATAQGFADGWQQWQTGAAEVLAALESIGQLLDTTGQNYQTTDEQASGTISRSGEGA